MGLSTTYTKVETDFLIQNLERKTTSGIKGIATQTNAPTAYTLSTYPNGLFEKWEVTAPLTLPNNWGDIAVTQAELDANFVYFMVENGIVTKHLSLKPQVTKDEIINANSNNVSSSDAVYNFTKNEISNKSPNLFNKRNFLFNKAFDTNSGVVVDSNNLNGISEFIKINGGETYGISIWNAVNTSNFPYSATVNLLGLYIVEYDVNGAYLGYKTLSNGEIFYNCVYKPDVNVGYIRINPNPSGETTLAQIAEVLIFSKINNFPINYVDYGEQINESNIDRIYANKIFDDSINYSPVNGNQNVYLFHTPFQIEQGLNKIVLEIYVQNPELIPFIVGGSSFVTIPSLLKSQQPKLIFKKSSKNNTFFIEFEHYFDVARYIETDINVSHKFVQNLSSIVNLKVYKIRIDDDGKPLGFEIGLTESQVDNIIAESVPPIVDQIIVENLNSTLLEKIDNRIEQQTPLMIQQEIGSNLNEYLSENIDNFSFLQPNYIQADSTFNLASLTSSMNGKFISVIQDIDLQGATIDFVAQNVKNLKIVFNGGRILNGKIKSNYTRCVFNSDEAFVNVEILNQFQNDFARPEWFGAKIDGIDGGIGVWTNDDSFAMNQALKFSSKVILSGERTMIVKKPIVMRSGNTIEVDKNFIVKLGKASNCTLLKNEHVDLPNTGQKNGVTYPVGFKRNTNISIKGGIWDGNAKYQNRNNSTVEYGDNPEVVGTTRFPDGDGIAYFGVMIKFADVDGLNIENVTFRNGRTYQLLIGGISNYNFNNIYSERSFHLVNQDGIHIHGNCFNGKINNVYGVSADDLIAVTTMEAGNLSMRIGDVKKLIISNVYEYGINPSATLENPIDVVGGEPNDFDAFGAIRISYTDEFIDDIIVENLYYNRPMKGCAVLISNIPNPNSSSTGQYDHGVGSVGTVTLRNISGRKNSGRPVGLGNYTKIDTLILENSDFRNIDNDYNSPLVWDLENFSADPNPFVNNKIRLLQIRNSNFTKGNSNTTEQGLIYTKSDIKEIVFDNFQMSETADSNGKIQFLVRGNAFNSLKIVNSKIQVGQVILTNSLQELFESNNDFSTSNLGISPIQRANTERLVISINPSTPIIGDKILKSYGIYLYTTSWNKL